MDILIALDLYEVILGELGGRSSTNENSSYVPVIVPDIWINPVILQRVLVM